MTDDDIEEFFATFNISSIETNRLIKRSNTVSAETELVRCFQIYLDSVKTDFPGSLNLSIQSRECYKNSFSITNTLIKSRPDETLLKWIDIEYQLFKVFENDRYGERIRVPFKTVEELIECANTILNRRKSRAGKSLEHHLAEMFGVFNLKFESQVVTEDNKRPDFIFPGSKFYRDNSFNVSNLIFLASKTTCKDRWRQILNEADRIEEKHLFTLQQGISMNQLNEMYGCKVKLVVPKPYISSYPEKFRSNIMTLNDFIGFVKSKQK
jgi:type II restriction enzyme